MKKGKILAILLLILFLTTAVGLACGPRGPIYGPLFPEYGPWKLKLPFSALTEEQIRKIWETREKFMKEIAPLREKLFAKRMELRSLWFSPELDEEKIKSLQKEIIDLRAKIAQKMGEARMEIYKILTTKK